MPLQLKKFLNPVIHFSERIPKPLQRNPHKFEHKSVS